MTGVGLILTYHRIGDEAIDPWGLQVTPEHFREHLQVLLTMGSVVPLSRVGVDTSTPHFAITVDDGYADTLSRLRRDIEQADAPVTAFIVSGAVGSDQEYWWDALEPLLDDSSGAASGLRATWRGWQEPASEAQRFYKEAVTLLRATASSEHETILGRLLGGGERPPARAGRRVVTPDELTRLGSCELLSIGSHTQSHPVLSTLAPEQQWDELAGAERVISEMLGRPLESLAYPFGQKTDYNAESIAIARRLGVASGCSNTTGVVTPGTPRLDLPRWQVHDCDGDEFAHRIRLLIG